MSYYDSFRTRFDSPVRASPQPMPPQRPQQSPPPASVTRTNRYGFQVPERTEKRSWIQDARDYGKDAHDGRVQAIGNYLGTPSPVLTDAAQPVAVQGVLANSGQLGHGVPAQVPAPLLEQNAQLPMLNTADLPQQTGNKRDGTYLSPPRMRIGMAEGLQRTGGAMIGASSQGLSAAMAAGLGAYGGIRDYNRGSEADEIDRQDQMMIEAQRAQADRYAAAQKAQAGMAENASIIGELGADISSLDQLLVDLGDERAAGKVTGPWDGTMGAALDGVKSSPDNVFRGNLRLRLQKVKVNATLAYVAKTKGAISEKEMALFESPIPSLVTNNDAHWIQWLTDLRNAQAAIKYRLENNIKVGWGAPVGYMPSESSSTSSTSSSLQTEFDAIK